MDSLRVAYWVVYVGMAVTLVSASVLLWSNIRSGTFVLAFGSLAAAVVFYGVQQYFELQPSEQSDIVTAEFTIDYSKPGFFVKEPPPLPAGNFGSVLLAGDWLAKNNPAAFDADPPQVQLVADLTLFSLVAFFGQSQPDWQLRIARYKTSRGPMTHWFGMSAPHECSRLGDSELTELLKNAGNSFAEAVAEVVLQLPSQSICLPPDTQVTMTRSRLTFRNPFCSISFDIQPSLAIFRDQIPGTGEHVDSLSDARPRLETHVTGVTVDVRFERLRSHHAKRDRYQAWVDQMLQGLHEWFERPPAA